MLTITDINTHSENLKEVEKLKESFQSYLSNTVNEGSVIIINNLPPIGNIMGNIDFLISTSINKISRNYLKVNIGSENHYIDNFIVLIKNIEEKIITFSNQESVFSPNGEFDYYESVKKNIHSFESFLYEKNRLNVFYIYNIQTQNSFKFKGDHVLINEPLSADNIINCVVNQYIKRFGNNRVSSTNKNELEILYGDNNLETCSSILEEINNISKIGILTKKKLDKISNPTKIVNEIYDNSGKRISIISGKAGTGKTLILLRILHKHAISHHNIRYLTYNNLLVFDIKQSLRNFGFSGDNRIAIGTIQSFFHKLSKKLGLPLILGENRVKELLDVCAKRVEKIRPIFDTYKSNYSKITSSESLLNEISNKEKNKIDYSEFKEFTNFLVKQKDLRNFDNIKNSYLDKKNIILANKIGQNIFLSDYYKVLELLYGAIDNSRKFYEDFEIKNRYDLLSILYNSDKYSTDNEITFSNFDNHVKSLNRTINWSTLLIIDEGQDFHILEKEILFKIRGSENIVISSGGRSQLVRHSNLLDWSVSFGKKISHSPFNLYGGSYRQKQNIIEFVNSFSNEFGIT